MITFLLIAVLALAAYILIVPRKFTDYSADAGAYRRIYCDWLMEEDPAARLALRRALDFIEGERADGMAGFGAILADLAQGAARTGLPEAAMLETFAAALAAPDRFGEIESAVSAMLAGDEMNFRCERIAPIPRRDLR